METKPAIITRTDLVKVVNFCKEISPTKYSQCYPSELNKTLKSLQRFSDKNDFIFVKTNLYDLIVLFGASINIENGIKENQVKEIVNNIVEFYDQLTILDIKHFLTLCKIGKYGKIYNRFDSIIFFEWLQIYVEDRIIEIENDNSNMKNTSDIKFNAIGETLFKLSPDTRKILETNTKKYEPKFTPREKTTWEIDQEEIYLKIHHEFCELHKKQGGLGGAMFVSYFGKMIDFEQFYNEKFYEYYGKN